MNQEITTFSSFGFAEPINRALKDMNYGAPTPIQAKTIPLLLNRRDVIAMAQTGTGKTAAFALPILQNIDTSSLKTQALILAPTRELAIQVADQIEQLGAHQKNLTIAVLCGGQEYKKQLKQLSQGAQIVVGTPGRIIDHIQRGKLVLKTLRTFILDEADEMLRMGFIEDVESILAQLPDDKQMGLFSATMPSRIRTIANTYLNKPESVEIRMDTATVKSIEQRLMFASGYQKPDALLRVLSVEEYQGVIVFVRTKSSTEEVATNLQQQGFRAMAIHGDITQALRERIIAQFRSGVIDILVATDVAARGLDVERVTHVINYDLPQDNETYVHRIGRTGRAGRSGVTILFATPKETRAIGNIERHTRQKITKVQVPDDHAIQTAKQQRFLTQIAERLQHENINSYKKMLQDYVEKNAVDPIDLAAALALLMHKDKAWKNKLPQVERPTKERFKEHGKEASYGKERTRERFKERRPAEKFERAAPRGREDVPQDLFRIDVGKVHGVKAGNIVGAIANEAGLQSKFITNLKINDDHSTVHLPKGMPKEVIRELTKAWVCGRQLNITLIK